MNFLNALPEGPAAVETNAVWWLDIHLGRTMIPDNPTAPEA